MEKKEIIRMVSTSKNVDDSENKNDIDETPFRNDFSMLHFSSLPTIEDATYEVEHARLEENNIEETPFLITPNLTKQPIEENPKTVHVEKKKENAVPSTPEQYNLNISVQDLPLSLRSRNGLCRGGIMTLRQLLQYDKESLLGVRNLGKYSIKEITDFLATTFHHGKKKISGENLSNQPLYTKETYISEIDTIPISPRTVNALMRGGVDTIGKLMRADSERILSIRNLGKKSFEEALCLKKQIPKLLIQSNYTESDSSDDVKNTFEMMVAAFALTDEDEIEELRLYCYHFNDPEDTEQERLEKWYHLPCVKSVATRKIANALKEHSVFGLRLSELRAMLPENFPEVLFEEILDQVAQKDHGKRYVQKSESLHSMLEKENIMNAPEFEILKSRMKNKTLEEIANQYGLTRERIRQKQERALRRIRKIADCSNVMITENRFRPLFETYAFQEKLFCTLTEQSSEVYRFLEFSVKKKGIAPIEKMFQEVQVPGWMVGNWEKYCQKSIDSQYLCITEDGNRLIEKTRHGIISYLIAKYCQDEMLFDDFVKLYQGFIVNHGLEDDSRLCISEFEKRSQENQLSARMDIFWKIGRKFRYYDIDAHDYTELLETLDLNQYHNVKLSTLKFIREYPELTQQYDIRDEYELHNLLKKIADKIDAPELQFGRMPHLCFGEFDQIAMIKAHMWKLAPISKEALANAISEDYGFRPESLIGLFGCIDLYEKDGVYIVDHKAMTEEQIKILSENLPDDFYYFDEIEQKFAMLFPDAEIELVNGFNLKRLGFVLNTTYAVKNYPSSSSYFHALLTKNDITDISAMRKRFYKINMFSSILYELKRDYTIIEFEKNKYVSIARLESLGFDRTKLKQYCDKVYAYAQNIDFFTIESLSKQGFTADLESLGFEPWFYSSILRKDHRFSHRKMGGTVLFHAAGQEASIRNLVFSILEQESSVDVDRLIAQLKEDYHIQLDRWDIIPRIQNTELYFDNIMDKIYRDYHTYYEELLSIDEEDEYEFIG